MCGIAGICGTNWTRHQLFAMRDRQSHRGPDANGVYLAPSGSAGLAHNRLSIIDLSDAGRQPMSNADGTLWLVFNGEIYNYIELKRELAGYPFRTNTDSEVISGGVSAVGRRVPRSPHWHVRLCALERA